MIWIFKKSNGSHLLVSAPTEDEALNIIKVRNLESVHGELHTELKMIRGCNGLIVKDFIIDE